MKPMGAILSLSQHIPKEPLEVLTANQKEPEKNLRAKKNHRTVDATIEYHRSTENLDNSIKYHIRSQESRMVKQKTSES